MLIYSHLCSVACDVDDDVASAFDDAVDDLHLTAVGAVQLAPFVLESRRPSFKMSGLLCEFVRTSQSHLRTADRQQDQRAPGGRS